MPNWCMNALTISHSKKEMLEKFCEGFNQDAACEAFCPQPPEIGDDWYDWRLSNWGVKWDFGCDQGQRAEIHDDSVAVSFDSAWGPPIEFYKTMESLGFVVEAMYFEPGMRFCGTYRNKVDHYVQFEDLDDIPDEVISEFGCESFFDNDD